MFFQVLVTFKNKSMISTVFFFFVYINVTSKKPTK